MSVGDILFPGNPKRREETIRLHQKLIDDMNSNFRVTNDLIGLLNTHLGANIPLIKIKEKGTIKENCDIFVETMNKIQEVLQGIDEELKKKLEPSLYQKLHDVTESDSTKMEIIQSVTNLISGLAGSAAATIVVKLVLRRITFETMTIVQNVMRKIAASAFGLVAGCGVGLAVDLIVSAILGAIEKSKLEKAIHELEGHVKEFEPASWAYQKAVEKVVVKLEDE